MANGFKMVRADGRDLGGDDFAPAPVQQGGNSSGGSLSFTDEGTMSGQVPIDIGGALAVGTALEFVGEDDGGPELRVGGFPVATSDNGVCVVAGSAGNMPGVLTDPPTAADFNALVDALTNGANVFRIPR